MNKIKSTLFLAILVAITATTTITLAGDGQIPIGGRPVSESNKTTTTITVAATEPNNENSFEILNYLWTVTSVLGQLKF